MINLPKRINALSRETLAADTALSRKGSWAMSKLKASKLAVPNKFFAERGLLALSGGGR